MVDGDKRTFINRTKTDHLGAFTFSLPYYLDGDSYQLEVSNKSLNEAGENMNAFGYFYQDGTNMERLASDSTLLVTFPVSELMTQVNHEVEIYDQISHPIAVEIAGPGSCDVFAGYEFTLRLREKSGKVDLRIETVNRQLNATLPPYQYEVSVIDVNKSDAFSEAVLDYFRSRSLTVDNHIYYALALADTEGITYDDTRYLRYNERTGISLAKLDDAYVESCGEYIMTSSSKDDELYAHSLQMELTPTQTINGNTCAATSGYMLVKFPGGIALDASGNDTIEYVSESGTWETVSLTATTPNIVTPYKQLLEVFFYDANHNYQGYTSQEILVTGEQSTENAQDVFVVADEDPVPVPLYVLRDPPGDKSSASINENSKFMFAVNNMDAGSGSTSVEADYSYALFGNTVSFGAKYGGGFFTGSGRGQMFALEFKQGISTAGGAAASDNLEGALDGRDADILIGMDMIMSYGLNEVLDYEACTPQKTRVLTVDPSKISTMWMYTRSQIENTIRYYKNVTDPDGSYEVVSSNSEVSGDDIIKRLENSYERFETMLEDLETEYNPICEMCSYAASYNAGNSVRSYHEDTYSGYKEDVLSFCKDYAAFDDANRACSDKTLFDIMDSWDNTIRDDYRMAYRKYLAMREMANVQNDYSIPWDAITGIEAELLENINHFDPLENITFGAGAKVKRQASNNRTSSSSGSLSYYASVEASFGFKTEQKVDVESWFGVGGGNEIDFSGDEVEIKAGVTAKVEGSYTRSNSFFDETNNSFKTSFTLDDDDDGDHFSVDVLHSGTYGSTKMSPYFNLVGGRSSCPYEPGTIARDNPVIQLSNELGELLPTAYFDLDPDAVLSIPVTVSSGNPFGEQRLVALHTPLGSNQHGLSLKLEGTRLNFQKSALVAVAPDTTYQAYLQVSKGNQNWYDFDDIVIQAKPYCSGSSNIWNSGGTVDMEFHYRKPISPLSISSDLGSWFVTDAGKGDSGSEIAEDVTFKLRDYDVEQNLHSLKAIVMEYKRVNDEVWTPMMDLTLQAEALSQEALYAYFD
ncbi:MAG TPA: hypothetical protein DCE41_02990, partial [Cytophagales bacterium]|nr:hypothetical protein [Cytophagales bacterium]